MSDIEGNALYTHMLDIEGNAVDTHICQILKVMQ